MVFHFDATLKLAHTVGPPVVPPPPPEKAKAAMPPDHPAMHIPCWRTSEPIQNAVLDTVCGMLKVERSQMEMTNHFAWGIHTTVTLELTVPVEQMDATQNDFTQFYNQVKGRTQAEGEPVAEFYEDESIAVEEIPGVTFNTHFEIKGIACTEWKPVEAAVFMECAQCGYTCGPEKAFQKHVKNNPGHCLKVPDTTVMQFNLTMDIPHTRAAVYEHLRAVQGDAQAEQRDDPAWKPPPEEPWRYPSSPAVTP